MASASARASVRTHGHAVGDREHRPAHDPHAGAAAAGIRPAPGARTARARAGPAPPRPAPARVTRPSARVRGAARHRRTGSVVGPVRGRVLVPRSRLRVRRSRPRLAPARVARAHRVRGRTRSDGARRRCAAAVVDGPPRGTVDRPRDPGHAERRPRRPHSTRVRGARPAVGLDRGDDRADAADLPFGHRRTPTSPGSSTTRRSSPASTP